jgi:hypothetical protein
MVLFHLHDVIAEFPEIVTASFRTERVKQQMQVMLA